jgi:integral membrane protein (TIGR01906 family)
MMHFMPKLQAATLVFSIVLLLISSSVTWAINDLSLYERGFDKYNISETSGIEKSELLAVSERIRGYFNSTDKSLDIKTTVDNQKRPLFGTKEIAHMKDVKRLVQGNYIIQVLSLVAVLSIFISAKLSFSSGAMQFICKYTMWGGIATIALITTIGLATLITFDQLFLAFHKISFANDFWKLDSSKDYLVIIFPQGFWKDATIFVATLVIISASILSTISGTYLWFLKRSSKLT